MGSLPAFNLLGGDEANRREAEKKEAERKASEKSGLSQMSGLWDQAIGKRDGGMKGDKGGLVPQVGNLWDSAIGQGKKREKVRDKNNFRLFGGSNTTKPAVDWGPGGALGIGCGAGVGVGLTGGTGIGATPWSSLRFVFGVGAWV